MNNETLKEITVIRTYSLTAWHVSEVKRIGLALGVSDAEVMRRAIEELSARVFAVSEVEQ